MIRETCSLILLYSPSLPFFTLLHLSSRHFHSLYIVTTHLLTESKFRMSAEPQSDFSDVLTNLALPKTSATLTLRIIKSFEYRTERSLVLHNINLETTTVGELKELARAGMLLMFVSFPRARISLKRKPNSYPYTARMEAVPYYHFW